VIVTMDGDLQNDPADIPALLSKLHEGYDAVLGERHQRRDNFLIRKLPSRIANWLIRRATGVHFRDFGCTLRVMRRDIARSLPLYGELHRFIPALAMQGGARITQIPVRHHPRVAGTTKYGITRTARVMLDLITVLFLHRYLTRPMHLFGFAGLVLAFLGGISLTATLSMKVLSGIDMTGNPLLLLSVMLLLMGGQAVAVGLLGELQARTYFESQGKPAYTVRETLNLKPLRIRRKSRRVRSNTVSVTAQV
jgi:glycosyltransferase involved in cell wall biosynthesis